MKSKIIVIVLSVTLIQPYFLYSQVECQKNIHVRITDIENPENVIQSFVWNYTEAQCSYRPPSITDFGITGIGVH